MYISDTSSYSVPAVKAEKCHTCIEYESFGCFIDISWQLDYAFGQSKLPSTEKGRLIVSKFFHAFCSLFGVQPLTKATYNAQTDLLTELIKQNSSRKIASIRLWPPIVLGPVNLAVHISIWLTSTPIHNDGSDKSLFDPYTARSNHKGPPTALLHDESQQVPGKFLHLHIICRQSLIRTKNGQDAQSSVGTRKMHFASSERNFPMFRSDNYVYIDRWPTAKSTSGKWPTSHDQSCSRRPLDDF